MIATIYNVCAPGYPFATGAIAVPGADSWRKQAFMRTRSVKNLAAPAVLRLQGQSVHQLKVDVPTTRTSTSAQERSP
jgi:hypothetical protein